jgi:anti-anti-sigma factor
MCPVESFPITSERVDDLYRVAPAGELDIASAPRLEAAFDAAERSDAASIVVDLSAITFIDSTGIQLLLRMTERCGGAPRLTVIPSAAVQRLLEITGLQEHLPLGDAPPLGEPPAAA